MAKTRIERIKKAPRARGAILGGKQPMSTTPSISQESYEVYVLRDKHGRYFGRMAEPVTKLRQAWRFYSLEELATVIGFEHYAPAADLEYQPVKVKITMVTIEQELETDV